MARPIKWTKEKKDKAIDIIYNGMYNGQSCRSIIDGADRNILPSYRVFLKWIDEDKILSKHYTYMREVRAEKIFDEILTISDSQQNDIVDKDGVKTVNHNVINRNRLQVDARKWILSKMNPKKYGDKQEVDIKANSVIQYKNVSKQFPDKE
jgi:hypothetical protein